MKVKKAQTKSREQVLVGFKMKRKENGIVLKLARGVEHLELNKNDSLIGFENEARTGKSGKQTPKLVFYKPLQSQK
ncbi:hypothetical protein J7L36_01360 [bacterium]|nr:hypothetical protein [bacterium]